MARSTTPVVHAEQGQGNIDSIVCNIAYSMVGRAVDLLVGADKTAHGIVSSVQFEAGAPKIVVGGARYDLKQVLTAVPTTIG